MNKSVTESDSDDGLYLSRATGVSVRKTAIQWTVGGKDWMKSKHGKAVLIYKSLSLCFCVFFLTHILTQLH